MTEKDVSGLAGANRNHEQWRSERPEHNIIVVHHVRVDLVAPGIAQAETVRHGVQRFRRLRAALGGIDVGK